MRHVSINLKILKKAMGCAVVAALMLTLFLTNALEYFELQAQDILYRETVILLPEIHLLGIDSETLVEFGPVQFWSRQRMADAIAILNSDPDWKPAVIAIDMIYSGNSNDPAADDALVQAAAEGGNVVFGAALTLDYNNDVIAFEKPFEALEKVSEYGILNAFIDDDSVVRKADLGMVVFGVPEKTFAQAIYKKYTGEEAPIPDSFHQPIHLAFSGVPGDFFAAEGLGISFKEIFDDDFEPSFYADEIVLIGPYASSMMDSYITSVDHKHQMHGVEIHANIVQMLLEENFKGYAQLWVNIVLLIFSLLVFSLIVMRFGDWISLGAAIVFIAGYLLFNKLMFKTGQILTLLYPPLSVAVLLGFSVVHNYINERAAKKAIKDMFSKYVDPELVNELIKTNAAHSGIGKTMHIAVLFVDIRGFTPMSERLKDEPETVVHILNDYLELTASCIFNNGGSVDKFIGDATMALFNGFTPLEDYTYKAVKAAHDIVNGAADLNARIMERYGFGVGFGVGVHCGNAVVGNIGPNFRKDYTAIGDTVNTAARLESNAGQSQVLISKEVIEALDGRITADSLGEIAMKGKGQVEVFALTGIV